MSDRTDFLHPDYEPGEFDQVERRLRQALARDAAAGAPVAPARHDPARGPRGRAGDRDRRLGAPPLADAPRRRRRGRRDHRRGLVVQPGRREPPSPRRRPTAPRSHRRRRPTDVDRLADQRPPTTSGPVDDPAGVPAGLLRRARSGTTSRPTSCSASSSAGPAHRRHPGGQGQGGPGAGHQRPALQQHRRLPPALVGPDHRRRDRDRRADHGRPRQRRRPGRGRRRREQAARRAGAGLDRAGRDPADPPRAVQGRRASRRRCSGRSPPTRPSPARRRTGSTRTSRRSGSPSPGRDQVLPAAKPVVVTGPGHRLRGHRQLAAQARHHRRSRPATPPPRSGLRCRATYSIDLGRLAPGDYTIRVLELSCKDGDKVAAEKTVSFSVK